MAMPGIWSYAYFASGRKEIGLTCGSTEDLPVYTILIRGEGINWEYRYDKDETIAPGTQQLVWSRDSAKEAFHIICLKQGLYQIKTEDKRLYQVRIRDGEYYFGRQDLPANALTRRIREADWLPEYKGMDVVPYSRTFFSEDVSEKYMMMVLSFPALCLAGS